MLSDSPVAGNHLLYPIPDHAGPLAMDDPKVGMLGQHSSVEGGEDLLLGFLTSETAKVDLEGGGA